MCCCQIQNNFRCSEDLCKLGNEYLNLSRFLTHPVLYDVCYVLVILFLYCVDRVLSTNCFISVYVIAFYSVVIVCN